jgi:formate dehydrogenase maturation protein FdhE
MPLDPETIFALHTMRQTGHGATVIEDEEFVTEKEEDLCPVCGSLMFESADESFALLCPVCDMQFH